MVYDTINCNKEPPNLILVMKALPFVGLAVPFNDRELRVTTCTTLEITSSQVSYMPKILSQLDPQARPRPHAPNTVLSQDVDLNPKCRNT